MSSWTIVSGLAFHPVRGTLASASWDGTVKVWDLYKSDRNSAPETFENGADVVCLAFRPDRNQICSGNIRGLLRIWNVKDGSLVCEIDCRKDIKGGKSDYNFLIYALFSSLLVTQGTNFISKDAK